MSSPRPPGPPPEVRLEPLDAMRLDAVLHIEQRAYSHAWTRGNFLDGLRAGYHMRVLVAGEASAETVLGYYIVMQGVAEAHLLNITVAPEHQGQGWARLMLDALALWARGVPAQPPLELLWLEVRAGNRRAIHVYEAQGYRRVGLRKDYYPDGHGRREDAVVMNLSLAPVASVLRDHVHVPL
ncbi:ribosomal-protein-alanine N-acetyltransferase [Hylemonella gracilis]|uniref:[Ribosomal protein bS18]-alanine N-acetyltransferase n=1 Tax=Hylemonella gracilis TaxID=80880 RepID=A0A4P6UPW9_9BURK|nr:ribosomal protein S18-alanine N-acetyltransferase [Hylemonella gracilis]QBK06370.1 ribosomal-protein-alanine N-acetyltransferase [Hylemonella gracilis]